MSCNQELIEIRAKGRSLEAIVSLRQNELIQNLRALVAVRFELAIPQIVMVFAGEVLSDEGTIDSRGIISGVTVHVVCRLAPTITPTPVPSSFPPKSRSSAGRSQAAASLLNILGHPRLVRSLLHAEPRIRLMIQKNAMLYHYLNSDRNLREVISWLFGPARLELVRRRDLCHMRLELVPAARRLLGQISYVLRQAYENKVAKTFQRASTSTGTATNPQRGLENKQPLPNPWLPKPKNTMDPQKRLKCNRVIKSMVSSDLLQLCKSARLVQRFLEDQEVDVPQEIVELTRKMPQKKQNHTGNGGEQHSTEEGEEHTGKEEKEPTRKEEEEHTREEEEEHTPSSVGLEKTTKSSPTPDKIRDHDVFQTQMDELVQMGYPDRRRNYSALKISLGNKDCAIRLLDHWNRTHL